MSLQLSSLVSGSSVCCLASPQHLGLAFRTSLSSAEGRPELQHIVVRADQHPFAFRLAIRGPWPVSATALISSGWTCCLSFGSPVMALSIRKSCRWFAANTRKAMASVRQAPDMDERVKSLFVSWRRRCAVAGPSLERPGPGSQALYDGEST